FEKKLASRLEPVVATVLSTSPRPSQHPDSIGQEATGIASAHHGEVLQGVFEADGRLHRALVTLPCGFMTSEATFVPDHTGRVIEDLGGALPPIDMLGFNTDGRGTGVDTLAHPVPHYSSVEIESFRVALGLLRRAVRDADPSLLGRVATLSSRINQRYLPKPR